MLQPRPYCERARSLKSPLFVARCRRTCSFAHNQRQQRRARSSPSIDVVTAVRGLRIRLQSTRDLRSRRRRAPLQRSTIFVARAAGRRSRCARLCARAVRRAANRRLRLRHRLRSAFVCARESQPKSQNLARARSHKNMRADAQLVAATMTTISNRRLNDYRRRGVRRQQKTAHFRLPLPQLWV